MIPPKTEELPSISLPLQLSSLDTTTMFGYASGPCISPPEIEHGYACVEITIDMDNIRELLDSAGTSGFNDIEFDDIEVLSDKDHWTVRIGVTGDELSRTRGLYERIQT